MADPKRSQGTPEKGGRETGQQGTERQDPERRGDRNPEPHKQSGRDKERREL